MVNGKWTGPSALPRELSTIHYSLFTIHYSLFTIHYSLFTIHYSLFTIHYSLFTIHYSLFTIHYSLTQSKLSFFLTSWMVLLAVAWIFSAPLSNTSLTNRGLS